jgi:hypothetical protein
MILVNVVHVQDDTTAAPGVEDHHFMCSECHEVERRRVLTRHGREIDTAPPIVPASAVRDEHIAALLRRVLAKIRGQ